MSFDLDRNSWRAFLSGARRQVSYLTGAKGLCDPTGAVKSALKTLGAGKTGHLHAQATLERVP